VQIIDPPNRHRELGIFKCLEEGTEDPMQQVMGCSVSYRIAIGPQQGRKVFTLQTIPAWEEDDRFAQVAKVAGFSLHAGVAAQAW
jgi:hypothetical protein